MKQLLLLISFIGIGHLSFAQEDGAQKVIDSLVKRLSVEKNDTVTAKILGDLAYSYASMDPDKGIEYAQRHLEIAKKMSGWPGEEAYAYSNLGANYETKSDLATALDYDLKALAIYERMKSNGNIAAISGNIGVIYESLHQLPKALKYDSICLAMQQKLGDKDGVISALISLGSTFFALDNRNKALECYEQARIIAEQIDNKGGLAVCLSNEGNIYGKDNQMSKAISCHFHALRLNREIDNKQNEAVNLANIGAAYVQIVQKELEFVPDSLISANKTENLHRAVSYLSQSVAMARQIGDIAFLGNSLGQLSDANELLGNYKEALAQRKESMLLKDSVSSEAVDLKVANLETKREADLKEKQISINKLVVNQKRNERILYLAGIGILALSVAGIYNRFKHQKKTAEMQHMALRQKEMLMKEIHHRVKNNLQVISSLLNMQIVNIADPLAKEALTESTNRLRAILLLHQQLYKDEEAGIIECGQFATDLFSQITAVFKQTNQTITLQNKIPPTVVDIDTGVSLGLILNELMTNSYKYAFDNGDGQITIGIEKTGSSYTLKYADSGKGLPAGLDIKSLKSLGMKILNSLSRQLGGAMTYDYSTHQFIITFKDVTGRKRQIKNVA